MTCILKTFNHIFVVFIVSVHFSYYVSWKIFCCNMISHNHVHVHQRFLEDYYSYYLVSINTMNDNISNIAVSTLDTTAPTRFTTGKVDEAVNVWTSTMTKLVLK